MTVDDYIRLCWLSGMTVDECLEAVKLRFLGVSTNSSIILVRSVHYIFYRTCRSYEEFTKTHIWRSSK